MSNPPETKDSYIDRFKPLIKHLKPDYHRRRIGVDQLSMTLADSFGHDKLKVIMDYFSKHVRLYVTDNHVGQTLAQHLYDHYYTWGRYDTIITDLGSNSTSQDVEQLNKWIGIQDQKSLVGRHESHGVEGSNKQIIRYLRALVSDERVMHRWSLHNVLRTVEYVLNDTINSETGTSAFLLRF
jgi:hypothetical protein